jgi:hypothetical protein
MLTGCESSAPASAPKNTSRHWLTPVFGLALSQEWRPDELEKSVNCEEPSKLTSMVSTLQSVCQMKNVESGVGTGLPLLIRPEASSRNNTEESYSRLVRFRLCS